MFGLRRRFVVASVVTGWAAADFGSAFGKPFPRFRHVIRRTVEVYRRWSSASAGGPWLTDHHDRRHHIAYVDIADDRSAIAPRVRTAMRRNREYEVTSTLRLGFT